MNAAKGLSFADGELAWTSFEKGVKIYTWKWDGMRRKGERSVEGVKRVHPTQKPVGLHEQILNDFTDPTDIIFDGFLGSGTELIACERTGRTCLAAELSPEYCDIAIARLIAENPAITPVLLSRATE